MKFFCLAFMEEKKWDAMSEGERNAFMAECVAYDDAMRKNGHLKGAEALQSVRTASTVRWRDGKPLITDGPFVETKEQLGGILVLETRDKSEAIELMAGHPGVRRGVCVEIRPADMEHCQPG